MKKNLNVVLNKQLYRSSLSHQSFIFRNLPPAVQIRPRPLTPKSIILINVSVFDRLKAFRKVARPQSLLPNEGLIEWWPFTFLLHPLSLSLLRSCQIFDFVFSSEISVSKPLKCVWEDILIWTKYLETKNRRKLNLYPTWGSDCILAVNPPTKSSILVGGFWTISRFSEQFFSNFLPTLYSWYSKRLGEGVFRLYPKNPTCYKITLMYGWNSQFDENSITSSTTLLNALFTTLRFS